MQMSLVLELQKLATDGKVLVTDLARKALMVASKLGLDKFQQWLQLELDGYADKEVPPHRVIHCEVKAFNQYRGWIPVIFEDKKTADALSTIRASQPIGELESILSRDPEGRITFPIPSDITSSLMKGSPLGLVPERHVSHTEIFGIVDAVRNQILAWSLKLEREGILGTDITFSEDEKEKAKADSSISIGNFHGVLGNVQAENLQIGNYASIHSKLKEAGIPQSDRNELENIFDDLATADGNNRKSVIERGLAWVEQHREVVGPLAQVIITWLGS